MKFNAKLNKEFEKLQKEWIELEKHGDKKHYDQFKITLNKFQSDIEQYRS